MRTPMLFTVVASSAMLLVACEDSALHSPLGDDPSPSIEAPTAHRAHTPGESVPLHIRTESTATWVEVLVLDDALGSDPDLDPDLVTLQVGQVFGLMNPWVIVPDDFGGRCSLPSLWVFHFEGRGVGSHTGRLEGDGSHCTYSPTAYGDGEWVSVTANGDEIQVEYDNGTGGDTDDPFVKTFEDEITIVGGTGRFADASGAGIERGVFDFLAGSFSMETEGYIVYDPSGR